MKAVVFAFIGGFKVNICQLYVEFLDVKFFANGILEMGCFGRRSSH
jgi:hypothetical protein